MDSVPGRVRGVDDFPSISARPRDKFHVGYEFAEAIRNAVRLGFVERQPTYLLDFAIWPHRGGPGCGRVLATWDGLLLGQCGLRLGLEQVFGDPDGSFERSFHEPDVTNDEMEKLRHRWHQLRPKRYPWSMGDSEIAIHLTYGISKSLHAFNSSSKSDGHKDQLYTMAFGNLITDVTAITIDPSHIPDMRASLGVPFLDDPELWDRSWQWSARVGELVAEAYASRRSSDRACVVMLRTACEVLLAEFAELEGAPAPPGLSSLSPWTTSPPPVKN